ncbi:2OG-Fe dioxygenase family protein [Priestia megaterium]
MKTLEVNNSLEDKARIYSEELENNGFLYINQTFYKGEIDLKEDLAKAQESFETLEADPKGGGRYRAHSRYIAHPNSLELELDVTNDYFQSKEYNYDDGGIVRKFNPISNSFLDNKLISNLINKDLHIATSTNLVNWEDKVTIGLHQVRYKVEAGEASYSSPVWLHRDDEPLVFVHLFDLSENALGGDNLIASSVKQIDQVMRLGKPLETLALGQKVFHAVTPLGSSNTEVAYRDILLVTFSQ